MLRDTSDRGYLGIATVFSLNLGRWSKYTSYRWHHYAGCVGIIALVSDGWSGKPSPLLHQFALLPFALAFGVVLLLLLFGSQTHLETALPYPERIPGNWRVLPLCFELASIGLIAAEDHHFRQFGYYLHPLSTTISLTAALLGGVLVWRGVSGRFVLLGTISVYAAGLWIAIRSFPLNYLRSDMLPVIGWADERLVHHLNPYTTMHVGSRVYDFPYLPGMLVAFWPAVWLHADLRLATLAYAIGVAWLIYQAAKESYELEVAALLSVFLLCPFLQYRHDLYLQPHWFALTLAVVLMQQRRHGWAAFAWGLSCAIYQLSWILLPFFLLNAYRRQGVREAGKLLILAAAGFFTIAGPFLSVAMHQVANNTVGQWSRLPHALADPINVSFWLTYLIRPDQLRWVQAGVLTVIFFFCALKGRCSTLTDTLRWMCCALAIFIPLNVLVDGYFYLTLLLLLLLYVCAANGWWKMTEFEA